MSKPVLTDKIILTSTQKEVLNGALLGDGSLFLHKNGINAQFCYGSKSQQHVEYVEHFFNDYISGEGIKYYTYFDNRTKKEYSRYSFRTYTNIYFTEQYNKWYVNKKKIIPQDLILTPLTCLIWYIGDGGICHNGRTEYIKLSTQCFSKEDQINILLPQLAAFEPSLQKADLDSNGEQQYFIYIPHRQEKNFLSFIGNCPFSDYQYKWTITEYKNAIPKDHTTKEKIFCELYQQGQSYYSIAKQFNIEPNAVKYYLIKNNIYCKEQYKNAVIQYIENKPINIYKSGAEASRILNINSSAISMACNGKRASAGGYSWKKYYNLSQEEKIEIQQYFTDFFNT